MLAAGEDAVARTPELLAVLRDAGVVDAGGAGLLEIVRGAFAGLYGEELAVRGGTGAGAVAPDHHAEPSPYRYCTSYVVSGPGVVAAELEAALTAIGDSLIVVGDAEATKVHVHTDDPGRALSLATAMGAVAPVEVADMHGQIVDRTRRLAQVAPEHRATDVVIVLQGDGNRAIAESLGARRIIIGGQTMNPSTGDIVQALRAEGADGAVVLPCNGERARRRPGGGGGLRHRLPRGRGAVDPGRPGRAGRVRPRRAGRRATPRRWRPRPRRSRAPR